MKTALQCDEFGTVRINRREQKRAFVSLGARRAEETFLQIARRDVGKSFGEVDKVLRQVDVANVLKSFNLLDHALGDERVAMSAVDDGNSGVAVEIFFAGRVEEVLHFSAHELRRVGVEMSEAGHYVFALLLQNFFCANEILQVNHSVRSSCLAKRSTC